MEIRDERKEKAKKLNSVGKVLSNAKCCEILLLLDVPMHTKMIAEKIHISLSRTSRLVDKLERTGFIKSHYETKSSKRGVYRIVERNIVNLVINL